MIGRLLNIQVGQRQNQCWPDIADIGVLCVPRYILLVSEFVLFLEQQQMDKSVEVFSFKDAYLFPQSLLCVINWKHAFAFNI